MRNAGILMAVALMFGGQAASAEEAAPQSVSAGAGVGEGEGQAEGPATGLAAGHAAGLGASLAAASASAASAQALLADQRGVGRAPADGQFGAAVSAGQLAAWRGGADTVSNDMHLSGAVSGNAALNVTSGMNIISSGSFSNAAGLPVAIQNSGANVLIQNATIINLQLQ